LGFEAADAGDFSIEEGAAKWETLPTKKRGTTSK